MGGRVLGWGDARTLHARQGCPASRQQDGEGGGSIGSPKAFGQGTSTARNAAPGTGRRSGRAQCEQQPSPPADALRAAHGQGAQAGVFIFVIMVTNSVKSTTPSPFLSTSSRMMSISASTEPVDCAGARGAQSRQLVSHARGADLLVSPRAPP